MKVASDGEWKYEIYSGNSNVGIVLIHEIFGLDDYIRDCAKSLTDSGISVAAVDLYKGKYEANLERSFGLRKSVTRPILLDCMGHGLEVLRKEISGEGRDPVIGAMGFCMGGGFALYSACHLNYDFAVDYYGSMDEVDDMKELRERSVLLVEGLDSERDMNWVRDYFIPSVVRYKIRADMHFYPNAGHAFHRPGDGQHNPSASRDCWEKTIGFVTQFKQKE